MRRLRTLTYSSLLSVFGLFRLKLVLNLPLDQDPSMVALESLESCCEVTNVVADVRF